MINNCKIPYAEWWRRLIGNFIDTLVVSIPSVLIPNFLFDYNVYPESPEYAQILLAFIYPIYLLIFEGIFNRTFGKMLTGTIVLSSKSCGKANFGQILGRTFFRLIPFEAFSFISNRPRGWHDSIPKTMVVQYKHYKSYQIDNTIESSILVKDPEYNKDRLIINVFGSYKVLNLGYKRLILVLGVIIPSIVGILFAIYAYDEFGTFVLVTLIGIFFWWVIIVLALWIKDGFNR